MSTMSIVVMVFAGLLLIVSAVFTYQSFRQKAESAKNHGRLPKSSRQQFWRRLAIGIFGIVLGGSLIGITTYAAYSNRAARTPATAIEETEQETATAETTTPSDAAPQETEEEKMTEAEATTEEQTEKDVIAAGQKLDDSEAVSDIREFINTQQAAVDSVLNVKSDIFGEHSVYYQRTGNASMDKVKAKYAGFNDAVNLPMPQLQIWHDVGTEWGRPGEVEGDKTIEERTAEVNKKILALTEDEQMEEYRWLWYDKLLTDVYCLDASYQYFKELPFIMKHNAELVNEFLEKYDEYCKIEGKDLTKDPLGIDCWLADTKGHEGELAYLTMTEEYHDYAVAAIMIWENFTIVGRRNWTPYEHFPLSTVVNGDTRLRRIEKSTAPIQKGFLQAIVFVYNPKGGVAEYGGWNTHDWRIERYKPEGKPTTINKVPPAKEEPPAQTTTTTTTTTGNNRTSKGSGNTSVTKEQTDQGGGTNNAGNGDGQQQDLETEKKNDQNALDNQQTEDTENTQVSSGTGGTDTAVTDPGVNIIGGDPGSTEESEGTPATDESGKNLSEEKVEGAIEVPAI